MTNNLTICFQAICFQAISSISIAYQTPTGSSSAVLFAKREGGVINNTTSAGVCRPFMNAYYPSKKHKMLY